MNSLTEISQRMNEQLSGKVVADVHVCKGDDDHESHVDITFTDGTFLHFVAQPNGFAVALSSVLQGVLQ